MNRLLALVCAACIGITALPVHGAETDTKRFADLEKKISVMEKTRLMNNEQVASALTRINAMQDDFSGIKGQIERNDHLIASQSADLSKRINDIDHRITAIEERLLIFSNQLSKALERLAPEEAAEGELYQKGLDLVAASKYLEAAAAFETYVKKYPKSTFAPSAKFWIAECFFSMRDYQRAIKEYQAFIEKYPRNAKTPEAVLKQGNSFYELNMLEEAKAFYEKVLQTYPKSSAAPQATEKLEKIASRKTAAETPTSNEAFGGYPAETLQQRMQRTKASTPEQTPEGKGTSREMRPDTDF